MQRYNIQVTCRYARGVAIRRRRETVISISGRQVKNNRQKEVAIQKLKDQDIWNYNFARGFVWV
jgi:hypothetical protein